MIFEVIRLKCDLRFYFNDLKMTSRLLSQNYFNIGIMGTYQMKDNGLNISKLHKNSFSTPFDCIMTAEMTYDLKIT